MSDTPEYKVCKAVHTSTGNHVEYRLDTSDYHHLVKLGVDFTQIRTGLRVKDVDKPKYQTPYTTLEGKQRPLTHIILGIPLNSGTNVRFKNGDVMDLRRFNLVYNPSNRTKGPPKPESIQPLPEAPPMGAPGTFGFVQVMRPVWVGFQYDRDGNYVEVCQNLDQILAKEELITEVM